MDWMVRIYWFLFESLYGVLHLNSWLTIICSNIAFFCSSCIFAYLCFLCIVFFFVLDLNIHIYEEESWCSGKSCRLVIRRSRVQVVDTASCKNCREWLRIKIPSDPTLLWIPCKAELHAPRLPFLYCFLPLFLFLDIHELRLRPKLLAQIENKAHLHLYIYI
jgi:hypothetical protein